MALCNSLRPVSVCFMKINPSFYRTALGYAIRNRPSPSLFRPTHHQRRQFCSLRNLGLYAEVNICNAYILLPPRQSYTNFGIVLGQGLTRPICKPRFLSTTTRTLLSKNALPKSPSSNAYTSPSSKQGTKSTLFYIAALGVVALGLSYAAVPLYRIFCQAYSYGGTIQQGHDFDKVESMKKIENRVITVRFNADIAASMTWNFRPQQYEIKVVPGETALAFYTARNPTDRPVIGISTYNVIPFDAGQYFNKIQCFCFEEQLLNPHEEVHMPVFFYIDPEFADDPKMETIDQLTLSYTFFEAREGVQYPIPNFAKH